MSFSFSAIDRPKAVDLFMHSLTLLRTDDYALLPGHDEADLNTCAFLCGVVKTFTAAGSTVEDILLYQLADATEGLLVTAVLLGDKDVSGIWWKARAELVSCQLGGL
jgi:hypothetical protein